MKKRIVFLTVGALSALCLGVAAINTTQASADETTLVMQGVGTSVRFKTENDETGNGIRFAFKVDKEDVGEGKTFSADFSNVTESGVIVIPTDLLGDAELTKDTANAQISKTIDSTETELDNKWLESDTSWYQMAYLWDIPEVSYARDITARAYAVVDGTTIYSDSISRSMREVARAAYDDTSDTKPGDEQKNELKEYLKYNVTFVDEKNSTTTATVTYQDKATAPTDPTASNGYHFMGWYVGENKYDFDKAVEGDLTLNAKWLDARNIDFTELKGDLPKTLFTAKKANGNDNTTLAYDETEGAQYVRAWRSDPIFINLGIVPTGLVKISVTLKYTNSGSNYFATNIDVYKNDASITDNQLGNFYLNVESIASDYYTYSFVNVKTNESHNDPLTSEPWKEALYLHLYGANGEPGFDYYIKSITVTPISEMGGVTLDENGCAKQTFTTNQDIANYILPRGGHYPVISDGKLQVTTGTQDAYLIMFDSIKAKKDDKIVLEMNISANCGLKGVFLKADGSVIVGWLGGLVSDGKLSCTFTKDQTDTLIGVYLDNWNDSKNHTLTSVEYISATNA